MRVRTVVAFVGAALVALAAATVFDLRKPSGHRRHLGRLIEQIQDEGFSAFTDVVRRKIDHNLMSFKTSSFRYLVVVGVAFVAYLFWWPPRHLVLLLQRVPELRATLIGFARARGARLRAQRRGRGRAGADARRVDLHAGPAARRAVTAQSSSRSGLRERRRQHVIDVLGRVRASEQEPLPALAAQREQLRRVAWWSRRLRRSSTRPSVRVMFTIAPTMVASSGSVPSPLMKLRSILTSSTAKRLR